MGPGDARKIHSQSLCSSNGNPSQFKDSVSVLGEVLWILFTPVPEMHLIGNCAKATVGKAGEGKTIVNSIFDVGNKTEAAKMGLSRGMRCDFHGAFFGFGESELRQCQK
jgi:hypothetical protein